MSRVPLAVRAIPRMAERAWFTPPPLSPRVRAGWERSIEEARPLEVVVGGRAHAGFGFGEGPLVLLFHGWGGRAAQMGRLAAAIAGRGFTAVAVDAPGHGEERWASTNIYEMANLVDATIDQVGCPEAIVTHSLGAMAVRHALGTDYEGRLVLIAPVLDIEEVLATFGERARLLPWTRASLRRRIRRFVGDDWDAFASGGRSSLVGVSTLIVHDPDDPDTAFSTSATLAALHPAVDLHPAPSLGHTKILQDPFVIDAVTSFLVGDEGVAPPRGVTSSAGGGSKEPAQPS